MTLKREIKDAYIEKGAPIYVKTHGDAVYVNDNETETLTQRLDDVKGKIDNNTSQLNDIKNVISSEIVDNPEYLKVIIDSEGRLLFGIKQDGSIEWSKGIPTPIKNTLSTEITDNPEYLKAIVDSEGRMLFGIKQDGAVEIVKLKANNISFSDKNISDIKEKIFTDDFYNQTKCDWSRKSNISIEIPRCAMLNFSNTTSMPVSKFENMKSIIEFWDMRGNYFKKKAIINAQGNSSMAWEKKNIAIDLCNDDWIGDDTFTIRFGDWVPQDSFHLKAYYTDGFKGIGAVSYKLFEQMENSRPITENRIWKKALIDMNNIGALSNGVTDIDDISIQFDNGAKNHPDAFPCIVYLNDDFYGIYSFQLKKNYLNANMNKSNTNHVWLDGEIGYDTILGGKIDWTKFEIRNPKKLYCMDGTKYDADTNMKELIDETSSVYSSSNKNFVKTAKVKKNIIRLNESITNIYNLNSAYEASKADDDKVALLTAFEKCFDVDNIIDYLILSDVVHNLDGFYKNWQWVTYDGIKWYISPYDLDCTFGIMWDGNKHLYPVTTGHSNESKWLPIFYIYTYYTERLNNRYKELRDKKILDRENILSILVDWTSRIGADNYKLEYEKWPNSPSNNTSIINTEYWEFVTDSDGNKVSISTKDYDNAKTYNVGEICSYGLEPYFQFKCIKSCTGIAPIRTFRIRDNIYRISKWLDFSLNQFDNVYRYNK